MLLFTDILVLSMLESKHEVEADSQEEADSEKCSSYHTPYPKIIFIQSSSVTSLSN